MRKFILTFLFCFVTLFSFGQRPFVNYFDSTYFNKYELVEFLPIERIMIHFDKEVDDEQLIDLGSGYYIAEVPHPDNMIIKTTADKTKAIVLHNSYAWGRHFEFNVEDNDRRMVLWYKDKRIYCGYIYDKKYKICKYFESKKEYKRFMRHPRFNN